MPIYAYLCSACGFRKDVLQKVADAVLTVCPSCGASAFHKQLSAPSFQLKGTGWYATDFKHSGSKPAAAPATPASEGGQGAAAGGTATEGAGSAGSSHSSKAGNAPEKPPTPVA